MRNCCICNYIESILLTGGKVNGIYAKKDIPRKRVLPGTRFSVEYPFVVEIGF